MKKLVVGAAVAAAAIAVPLAVAPSMSGATGGSPSTEISINDKADYDFQGTTLDLSGKAKCTGTGGQGMVSASVSQAPPETPFPITLSTGDNLIVCDGQWHSFGLTILGAGYDVGRAKATVTVVPVAGSPMKTVTKYITLVAV